MVMAMQIQTFIEPDAFMKMTRDYISQLRNSPPAFGNDHVLVPGDPERQNRMHRAQHGIDLAESTWAELQALYK
jgi:LDH2 family malate/lactate/ureidoglycolate dehydrogenase